MSNDTSRNKLLLFMISSSVNTAYFAYYPSNASRDWVSDVKNMITIFKPYVEGQINTGNANYYYTTAQDQNQSSNNLFIMIKTQYKYNKNLAENVIQNYKEYLTPEEGENEIPIFKQNTFLHGLTDVTKKIIGEFFEDNKYDVKDFNNDDISSSWTVKEEGVWGLNQINEIKYKVNKGSITIRNQKTQMECNTVFNEWLNGEEDRQDDKYANIIKSDQIENKDEQFYMKEVIELKKIEWWRKLKIVFIIICIIMAITLYTAVPFMIKLKDANEESSEDKGQSLMI